MNLETLNTLGLGSLGNTLYINADGANCLTENSELEEEQLFNARMRVVYSVIRLSALEHKYSAVIPFSMLSDIPAISDALKEEGFQVEAFVDYDSFTDELKNVLIIKWGGNTND